MSGLADRPDDAGRRFRDAYARHRGREGRGAGGRGEALALPYVTAGPQADQWAIRARTFEKFMNAVLRPRGREVAPRPLRVVDLGSGNGWLCYRVALEGHRPLALDWRRDHVDGLGAAVAYHGRAGSCFPCVVASFEALPLAPRAFDIAVFNAAIHYTLDLPRTITEAARVVAPGGRIAILDSPFYARFADGIAMVQEKQRNGTKHFGDLAPDLFALPVLEFLTRDMLVEASSGPGVRWRRHRVRYPLRYELRPLMARLGGRRRPSRFDLWEGRVP